MAREGYEIAAEMIAKAEAILAARGYSASQSSLGDARYWTRPGDVIRIRTATYEHKHDATVDLVITPERAGQISLSEAEITSIVDQAIRVAERMAAEIDDGTDDADLEEIANMSPEEVQRRLRGE